MRLKPLVAALMVVVAASAAALARGNLDPAFPYQARMIDPVTCEVEMRDVVTAPNGTKLLRVWVPIPPSDSAQTVADEQLETFPENVTPTFASMTSHRFKPDHPVVYSFSDWSSLEKEAGTP